MRITQKQVKESGFLTFIGRSVKVNKPTKDEAVEMDLPTLVTYIAADSFYFRAGVPMSMSERWKVSIKNAQHWAKQGRNEILKTFFNIGLTENELMWQNMGY